MESSIKPTAKYAFEVSWEVCNKVGGIFTVLESKAAQMASHYPHYYVVGPYFDDKTRGQFEEKPPPEDFKRVFAELEKQGIRCHFGTWLIQGEPSAILIDFNGFWPQANRIKGELWKQYKIDSLGAGNDFTEPVLWSYAAGRLIELFSPVAREKIVVHFHEWLSGAGLLYLKREGTFATSNIASVFTTHATVLGRTLAGNNIPLYAILETIDPEKEAYNYGVHSKHQLEKNAAKWTDCFTTVSEITGIEAEKFLLRKPDVILPNGLDMQRFPTLEEVGIKHRLQRDKIREFLLYYFFPYYTFDVKNTLFYFIFSRYEFHNKGIDLSIKALGLLNRRLKEDKSRKTIVAFFWIPTEVRGIKTGLLEVREMFRDINESLKEVEYETEENILYALLSDEKFERTDLFEKGFLREVKKKILRMRRNGIPPAATHDVADPNDVILRSFRDEGLENKTEDRVKVIFYPIYLTGSDGLLNLSLYECIGGSHLGIFPSFYEPWGYTPLEAAAFGVPAITTDLSGFGRFCLKKNTHPTNPGVFVLERQDKSDAEATHDLFKILLYYSQASNEERGENKVHAREIAQLADWKILITHYIEAHNMAIERRL
ncbi:MAG: hypothetical protein A2939_01405 [Parcubacteria group bacterium RIFCSPLOWO2_01_FULL_48_18]|nr:MAG: hypothetical protein A2939_01405 [Parcubacteria group bacterium RIFCSPLOWO2_01_FULL_48_18]OHB22136.1 MAG: hypothetical protein A3J67_04425 [Parcubacteria group bacterium RIFCSPHIGHO2_02_FULL_48_10b]